MRRQQFLGGSSEAEVLANPCIENGRMVQILGTATVVLAAGWFSRQAQPRVAAGWTHSTYTLVIKALTLLFAAFMTAAVLFNGLAIFNQDWWVAPVFLLTVAASYLFVYEVFFTSLRWNEMEVEVRHFPFRPRAMKFQDIVSVKFHGTTESVTFSSQTGSRIWFPYGYRVGARRLFALMSARDADSEA
ncbi:MAG TPA: hypothetical protein VLJ57_00835 [Burkholderiaceae bacterium]|nr:hypothetical protein [Burkholderiaceae bacterium]